MAEINQPAPIKPVWPTRRDKRPVKRPFENPGSRERERRQRKRSDDDEQPPIVDDYA